ncbi:hypothetical protein [Candidatus Mycolicibacterium alkanivorans]|uniref:Serine/threonine protein kinase n=1 Tax=Candidatus Mycolicibacterium alkanivorans TaxID=2954114 RepID=A0ABS9YZI8_9MYCO|nr:hypothetical protein [Candidatus Mycolicibacterium alkanivorans]MCI4675744.1 hypothetical protein [Candidatus Mycolicibacterium alkanivorans]
MSVDHPLDPNPGTSQRSRLLAPLAAGAVLAAVSMVVGVTVNSGSADSLPVAQAAPSTTTMTTATSSAASSSYKADSKGYLDTKARCDDSQIVAAYGRTQRSLVAICVDPSGDLQYRGVRLSDNASLKLSATRGSDGTVTAGNDGVTYSISPKLFLVSEGDNVIYRDSWIEFEQPGFSGSSTSSAATTTATTSGSATTTVSTTTVTVTTSVTPTTSKSGG